MAIFKIVIVIIACPRDSTGAGEMLCRGRGTCMGYLNNRWRFVLTYHDDVDDDYDDDKRNLYGIPQQ